MSAGDAQPAGETGKSLWHHRDFLKMWSGETVSLVGDQFTGLAFPLTAVLILHASAGQMGVLQALGTLPFLFWGWSRACGRTGIEGAG